MSPDADARKPETCTEQLPFRLPCTGLSASCCHIACLCADLTRVPDDSTQRAKHSQAPFEGSLAPSRRSKHKHPDGPRPGVMLVITCSATFAASANSAHIPPAGTALPSMCSVSTALHTPNRQKAAT